MFVELVTFLDDNRDGGGGDNSSRSNKDGGGGDILTLLHRVIKEPPTKTEIINSKLGIKLNYRRKLLEEGSEEQRLITQVLSLFKNILNDTAKESIISNDDIAKESINSNKVDGQDTNEDESLSLIYSKLLVDDEVRDKCFSLLIAAFTQNLKPKERKEYWGADQLMLETARAIEEGLHLKYLGDPKNYKQEFRSKYLNLKECRNSLLRDDLLSGDVSIMEFISMTPRQMANPARKREIDHLIKENLREAQASTDNDAETDQFKCGRCLMRKAKYYQLQTRSADEPMTTFVTCVNCGNRWRF